MIDLSNKKLNDGDIDILITVLSKSKELHTLNLSDNYLTLADDKLATTKSPLERLWLKNNHINDVGAKHIAAVIERNENLKSIVLSGNKIGPIGAEYLGESLAETHTLERLSLNGNQIGDRGCVSFANALAQNHALLRLELGFNAIGVMGIESLEHALKDSETIEAISLDNNLMGNEGAACFASVLMVNKSLQELDLSYNDIDKGGVESLTESIVLNNSLCELKLGGNKIGDDLITSFANSLINNSTLQRIHLGKKGILYTTESCIELRSNPSRRKKASILYRYEKHKSSGPATNQLPSNSRELSLQGRAKSQNLKIAALKAELKEYKPKVVDLTQDNNDDQQQAQAKRPRTGEPANSVLALMHETQVKVKAEVGEYKKQAAQATERAEAAKDEVTAAKKKAEAAEIELERTKECPICYEVVDDFYALDPCRHMMCFDCTKLFGVCPTCKQKVESAFKMHK